jgi:glycosyltransferase involved in cell wall biosynthesis
VRRVLFITFHFPPSVEVGAYSCAQIARYLPLQGWEPIVLAATDRHYQFVDGRVAPTAHVIHTAVIPHPLVVYRRLKALLRRSEDSASSHPQASQSTDSRVRTRGSLTELLTVPDMYLGWLPPAVLSGLRARRRFRIEHLLSSGPCWTNHLVGLVLATITRVTWTAHFRDPWLDELSDDAVHNFARRLNIALERAVVTHADSVVCVTEQHSELLRRRYAHLPAGKFVTVPNGYDEAEWAGVSAENAGRRTAANEKFVISYAGWLYRERNPEPVFRALRHLIDEGIVDASRVEIDLIGWCETAQGESIREIAERWQVDGCLRLEGPLTKGETFRRISQSNLLLLLAEGWTLRVPAKAYEYLRAGRSILALAPTRGAVADLFKKTGGAWVVEHVDDAGIVAAVREAYVSWSTGRPSRAPDQQAVAEFDRSRLAGRLATVFDAASHVAEGCA